MPSLLESIFDFGIKVAQYGVNLCILTTCVVIIYLIFVVAQYFELLFQTGGWNQVTTKIKANFEKKEELVLEIDQTQKKSSHKKFWKLIGYAYLIGIGTALVMTFLIWILLFGAFFLILKCAKFYFAR